MLKKVIKFKDFNGDEKSVEAYFNLNKTECVDLNLQYEDYGGLVGYLKKLLEDKTEKGELRQKPAVDFVRKIVEMAYGVRPKDDPSLFLKEDDNGRRFVQRFKQSSAYDTLVFDLLSGEESLDEFITSITPEVTAEQKKEAEKYLKKEGLGEIIEMKKLEV